MAVTTSGPFIVRVKAAASGLQNFATRRSQPGVVRWFEFDKIADFGERNLTNNFGFNWGVMAGSPRAGGITDYPVLDTTLAPPGGSGLGCMRFDITNSPNDTGTWFCNPSNDYSKSWDVGETYYVQWRQRFQAISIRRNNGGFIGGFKQAIFGPADTGSTLNKIKSSCTFSEVVTQSYQGGANPPNPIYDYAFPFWYTGCPSVGGNTNLYEPYPPEFQKFQNARAAPYCTYTAPNGYAPPGGNCFIYHPDEWMTFQVAITFGPVRANVGTPNENIPNCRVRAWGARQGQPQEPILDFFPLTINSPMWNTPAEETATRGHHGKIWFAMRWAPPNPFTPWSSWYAQLIISENFIADAL